MNISIEELKKTMQGVLTITGLTESDIFVKKISKNAFRLPNGNITTKTGLLDFNEKMRKTYEKKFKNK